MPDLASFSIPISFSLFHLTIDLNFVCFHYPISYIDLAKMQGHQILRQRGVSWIWHHNQNNLGFICRDSDNVFHQLLHMSRF